MARYCTLIVILFHLYSNTFPQKISLPKDHAFSGTMVLSVEGGATYGLTDLKDHVFDYAGRGIIEYFLPASSASSFGFRLFAGGGYLSGKDSIFEKSEFRSSLLFGGGELIYCLSLGDWVFPYLGAGASLLHFNPDFKSNGIRKPDGNFKRNVVNINGEFGVRLMLSRDLSFNLGGTVFVNMHDNLDNDALETARKDDIFFTGMAGLSYSFFRKADLDEDGKDNDEDFCIDEPEDFDGYEDNDGCPDTDNDNDYINDSRDDCPDQPEDYDGFYDKDGCPEPDNDLDGTPDAEDKCANQKEDFDGYEDNDGCPEYDNDNDGLLDHEDKCPYLAETWNGFEDSDGCPDSKPEPVQQAPVQIVLSAGTNFNSGKAVLNSSSYTELDKIVSVIQENQTTRWRIEGHTDSRGSSQANKKLSEARAKAVLEYFLGKGINGNRFDVVGFGEEMPIADNNTEEGRMKNRRVVILRIN